jgi:hypothetical protein
MKKMSKKNRKLNKKGQIGEVIEDFPAFILIILMLVLIILFTAILHGSNVNARQEKIDKKVIQDKMEIMLNSLLQEKQENGLTFSDLIRNNTKGIKERLQKEVEKVCDESRDTRNVYGCYADIYYENAIQECKKNSEKLSENFCIFIPDDKIIAIKVDTVWGVNLM